jgi:hypothetical protein
VHTLTLTDEQADFICACFMFSIATINRNMPLAVRNMELLQRVDAAVSPQSADDLTKKVIALAQSYQVREEQGHAYGV